LVGAALAHVQPVNSILNDEEEVVPVVVPIHVVVPPSAHVTLTLVPAGSVVVPLNTKLTHEIGVVDLADHEVPVKSPDTSGRATPATRVDKDAAMIRQILPNHIVIFLPRLANLSLCILALGVNAELPHGTIQIADSRGTSSLF